MGFSAHFAVKCKAAHQGKTAHSGTPEAAGGEAITQCGANRATHRSANRAGSLTSDRGADDLPEHILFLFCVSAKGKPEAVVRFRV
jgi:hypothetical protein|tara:strand:- start:69876 stop:70133 length:258 start_codon:yes stop_codon:yes gene_type:complete